MTITISWPSVEEASKAELTILGMYNRVGDSDLRAGVIKLSNQIRDAIANAEADPNDDLI